MAECRTVDNVLAIIEPYNKRTLSVSGLQFRHPVVAVTARV